MTAALLLWLAAASPVPGQRKEVPRVLFVCEHGSVKSLIAQEWFNRRAKERGLAVRAVSRGLEPDSAVPARIAGELRKDGFHVRRFVPRPATAAELGRAVRVIAIGLDEGALGPGVAVEAWDGIPAASEDYAASRDALRARIEVLLSRLAPHR